MSAGIALLPFKKGHPSAPNLDSTTREGGHHLPPLILGFGVHSWSNLHPSWIDPAEDIIEEALNLFRLNVFAKSFDIRGPADRTLVYLFLVIGECLGRVRPEMSMAEAQRALAALATQPVALPGEPAFPLNGMFPSVQRGSEAEQLRAYLGGIRGETGARLLARLYPSRADAKGPNPWWIAYQRRKFMNKTL